MFKHPLVLASSSPRRKEILKMVGLEFDVVPSTYVEPFHSSRLIDPQSFAEELAFEKGKEVYSRQEQSSIVLSADTIGVLGDEVLEKPKNKDDARRMIQLLSGKQHEVMTAVALFSPGGSPQIETVITKVSFLPLTSEDIERYLDSEEYMDKAAAYAIQGGAAVFIDKIVGDYWNVVGLPIATVWKLLKPHRQEIR